MNNKRQLQKQATKLLLNSAKPVKSLVLPPLRGLNTKLFPKPRQGKFLILENFLGEVTPPVASRLGGHRLFQGQIPTHPLNMMHRLSNHVSGDLNHDDDATMQVMIGKP